MIFTRRDKKAFNNSTYCFFCKKDFHSKTMSKTIYKVRDHDHFNGK